MLNKEAFIIESQNQPTKCHDAKTQRRKGQYPFASLRLCDFAFSHPVFRYSVSITLGTARVTTRHFAGPRLARLVYPDEREITYTYHDNGAIHQTGDYDPLNLPSANDGWTACWNFDTDPTDSPDYYTRELPYFYHQNTLFSVVALTDAAGKRVEGYVYDPYGQHLTFTDANADGVITFSLSTDTVTRSGPSAFKNPYTFTGRRVDVETGLLYYRNRLHSTSRGWRQTIIRFGF